MKKIYLDFSYWKDSRGSWWLEYPTGFKTILPQAETESEVKDTIDAIIASF